MVLAEQSFAFTHQEVLDSAYFITQQNEKDTNSLQKLSLSQSKMGIVSAQHTSEIVSFNSKTPRKNDVTHRNTARLAIHKG